MSEEDRLILDNDIRWYSRNELLKNKGNYNFYITTDMAVSLKEKADFSVISVWAYNANGDWFWVDGICERLLMDAFIDKLFMYAQMYKPQQVGLEVSGQQAGFVRWIQNQMMERNQWFTLASDNNSGTPGIRPNTNKLTRFNTVVPWFKAGKMFFPEELKQSPVIGEAIGELSLASPSGFKSKHDDFLDTISMLQNLKAWKPSESAGVLVEGDDGVWGLAEPEGPDGNMHSYIV